MNRRDPQSVGDATVQSLADRLRVLSASAPRTIVGLCGAPGAGKSTLAAELVDELGPGVAVVVPMDGFHLANQVLRDLGLADRKGAPETFDVHAYVAVLRRLVDRTDPVVYVPEFRRELEESFASALAVPRDIPLVLTEGNYLLLPDGAWPRARALMDEVWYLDVDEHTRRERLVARHCRHGRSRAEALDWVARVDEPNAVAIAATAPSADVRIRFRGQPSAGRVGTAMPR
ncbi:MAG: nucleoside/nucleotide kinase family protein [Angustibacter sp.]